MRSGAQWLNNHYAANDYYSEKERVLGQWIGKGARALGLDGQSISGQDKSFLAVFSGKTSHGEKLKQRDSEIIGYDFQCSAQKSVSIMAIIGGDQRLIEAHYTAVTEAFMELEALAAIQSGQGKDKHRETTGILCAARFDHDTSRSLDPQLHTHFATANFTVGVDGKRYGLETYDMVKAIRYAGKAYQSALRREVNRCGYVTIDKLTEHGQIEGFEIAGVSDRLLSLYSQRRAEIEQAIDQWKLDYGRDPTATEIHVMAKETRAEKLIEISTAKVREQQRARAGQDNLTELNQLKTDALERTDNPLTRELIDTRELLTSTREHLSERLATFGEHQLLAEALNRGMGRVDLTELKTSIKEDCQLVSLDNRETPIRLLSDRSNLTREIQSVQFVDRTQGSRPAINDQFQALSDCELRDGKWMKYDAGQWHDYTDQKLAVETLLKTKDQVFALRGVAGAGKTTALRAFHAGIEASGRTHIMLAPTRKAVESLKKAIGSDVQTVENFLRSVRNGKLDPTGTVITVDEWGLLSNRSGHEILKIAEQAGADIRFVGDTKQHAAVEAGDFGRTLERHSNIRSVALSKINRQRDPDYNAAITAMAAGRTIEGLQLLDQKDWIHDASAEYIRSAAARYLQQTENGKQLVNASNEPIVLGIGPTHVELKAFTKEVRSGLKQTGTLRGPSIERQVFQPNDITNAQRCDIATYRPGISVTLTSEVDKITGLNAQEVYTVVSTSRTDRVQLASSSGKEKVINIKKHGNKLEIGHLTTIELQKGDRILFRANSKGIVNGQLATIIGQDDQGRLLTTDGLTVPNNYLRISHGYATTSHTSQGVTAEKAVVFGERFDRKALYVSMSRAKLRTDLYTPDKERLFQSVERTSGDRQGTLDALLANKQANKHIKHLSESYHDLAESYFQQAKDFEERGNLSMAAQNQAEAFEYRTLDLLQQAYENGNQHEIQCLSTNIAPEQSQEVKHRAELVNQSKEGERFQKQLQALDLSDLKGRNRLTDSREYLAARYRQIKAQSGQVISKEDALARFKDSPSLHEPRIFSEKLKAAFIDRSKEHQRGKEQSKPDRSQERTR